MNPSREELAAITAALVVLERERAEAIATAAPPGPAVPSEWVRASRLVARRTALARGPWRLDGRIRHRAGR